MDIKNNWKPIRRLAIILSIIASMLLEGCEQDLQEIETEHDITTSVPEFKGVLITDETDELSDARFEPLHEKFASFQVYRLDLPSMADFVSNQPGEAFKLFLSDEFQWDMSLVSSGLLDEDYASYGLSSGGRVETVPMKDIYYKGDTKDEGKITITLDKQLINAMFRYDDEQIFIENVTNIGIDGTENEIIIYRASDIISSEKFTCTAENIEEKDNGGRVSVTEDDCRVSRVIDVITTTTYESYITIGNQDINLINNFHLTYINHMSSYYEEFNIKFRVTEQYVMIEDLGDPIKQIDFEGKALIILRNYRGDGVVGEANYDGLCQRDPEAAYMRVTAYGGTSHIKQTYAHEMGHLLGAQHILEKHFIMSKIVDEGESSSTWHPTTISVINEGKFKSCVYCEAPVTRGMNLFDKGRGNPNIVGQTSVSASEIITGDFDGDGKQDLFTIESGGWHIAYASALHRWERVGSSGIPQQNLLIGDFDGDGSDDLMTSLSTGWHVSYGAATSWNKIVGSNAHVSTLAAGDFNGDGIDDFMRLWNDLNGQGKGWYAVLSRPNGYGSWQKVSDADVEMKNVLIGDFNNDKVDDILASFGSSMSSGAGLYIIFGKKTTPFGNWVKVSSSAIPLSDLRIGDFNNDGKDDLLRYGGIDFDQGAGWYVLYGASGSWQKIRDNFQVGEGVNSLLTGDFTGDTTADVIYIK